MRSVHWLVSIASVLTVSCTWPGAEPEAANRDVTERTVFMHKGFRYERLRQNQAAQCGGHRQVLKSYWTQFASRGDRKARAHRFDRAKN
jgi:hypothetical protein